jgi:hypothetical protein
MSKPTRIQHGGVGVYLNDTQADRVQTFGSSTALNTEDLKEVGNKNIVEVIDGIPTIDVTLDTNQYGSIKTICQLSNQNFDYAYKQIVPSSGLVVAITSGAYYIDEMRYSTAGTTHDYTAALPAANHAKICIISIDANGTMHYDDGTEFQYGGGVIETPNRPAVAGQLILGEVYLINGLTEITDDYIANFHNSTSVTLDDFEYAKVDVVVPVKESGDNTDTDKYITRTMYMENAFCNRLDLSFNTDGLSTENFSLETDNKKWFLNACRVVVVDRFKGNGALTSFTMSQTPTQLANLNYGLKVRVYSSATDTYTDLTEVTGAPAAGQFRITPGGPTLTTGSTYPATATIILRYTANINEDTNFEMLPNPKEPHPDPAGGVKQGNCEIYIVGPSPDSFTPSGPTYWPSAYYSPSYSDTGGEIFTLRLESVTITADLTREALNEIGHALPYDRPLTIPVNVTIAANAKSSNLEEFARYIERRAEWLATTLNEAGIENLSKDLELRAYVFRETDVKRDDVPFRWQPYLKVLSISDVSVTDEAFEIGVDADATQTFNMKADNITITARV